MTSPLASSLKIQLMFWHWCGAIEDAMLYNKE